MKKFIMLSIVFLIASTGLSAQTGKPKTGTAQQQVYTCPMHPEVVSNKPGKCPKCGMTLVLKKNRKPVDTAVNKMPVHPADSPVHKMPM